MNNCFGITQAARQIGCSERWLREAPKKGKIPTARRDVNGWRTYTQEDIDIIKALLIGQSPNTSISKASSRAVSSGPPIITLSEVIARLEYIETRLREIELIIEREEQ